jgi:thioredoxin-like negative regulator of GroEL
MRTRAAETVSGWLAAGLALVMAQAYLPAQAEIPLPGSEGKLQLVWARDFDSALKTAEKENKPILMDVTTDWCGWSKKMDRETFAKLSVQEQLQDCVLVRLNPETSEQNRAIAQRYSAESYPTMVILNHRGESLAQKSGYQDEQDCTKFLQGALAGFRQHGALGYKPFELSPDDPLRQAIARMPQAETLPPSTASILLLDSSSVRIESNAVARFVNRIAQYAVDPDRGPIQQVARSYNSSRETVTLKAVRVLGSDGKGREVDVSLAEDEHSYSEQSIYWDVRQVTLDLPPLKQGQILDVIEERELRPVMPGQFSMRWVISPPLIVMGDLTINFPASLGLRYHKIRADTPISETRNSDGTVSWRLATQNLEMPEPELFAPLPYEEWKSYVFATTATWDDVARWYNGLCTGRDVLPGDAKAKVDKLKQAHSKPEDLLQAIFDWVTRDIRYVSVAFGLSSHQPHPVAETLKNRYGDCKDQALLLHALLREAQMPSSLVLLGMGCDRELEAPLPTINLFDHCILEARLGEKRFYLDPSAGPAPLGWLPAQCSGAEALRINGNQGELLTLPAYKAQESSSRRRIVKLSPNGSATVTDIQELKGPLAHATKQSMRQTNLVKMRKSFEDGLKSAGQKLLEFSVTDPNSEGDTYQFKLGYTVARFASRSGEGLVFKLAADANTEQDWTAALEVPRVRPFRFYPGDVGVQTYEVELPAGAEVKSKPDDLELETAFVRATRKVRVKANTITLTEKSSLLDAKLPASESTTVLAAMRKLQDHRNHSFIVSLPASGPAAAAAGGGP